MVKMMSLVLVNYQHDACATRNGEVARCCACEDQLGKADTQTGWLAQLQEVPRCKMYYDVQNTLAECLEVNLDGHITTSVSPSEFLDSPL